jgi:hypothetical protein
LAKAAEEVVERLGQPYRQKKRGRPLKLNPGAAAVLVITLAAQGYTFREAEDLTPEIAGGEADHVTIWRYFTRIGRGYIERAIRLLFELIRRNIEDTIFMLDSTGIGCDRSEDGLKLHVLAGYSPDEGRLAIARAEVTGFFAHDAPVGERLLTDGEGEMLLADKAYDSNRLRRRARRHGLVPNIKFRRTSAPTTQEAAQGFDFDEAKYRLRGIVEGVFGSGEVRHGNKTRCRLRMSRAKDVLLRVLGFNLRAYMKAKVALSTAANYLFPRILKQPLLTDIFLY